MSINRARLTIVTGWFVAVVAALSIRVAIGAPITVLAGVGLLLVGCVPAIVLYAVFRGAPPKTIGEVLYDAEQAPQVAVRPMSGASGAKGIDAARR